MTPTVPKKFRHILHPTDFSAGGDVAFQHALALAACSRAELSIVHTGRGATLGHSWDAFPKVRETLSQWGRLPADAAPSDVVDLGMDVHKLDLGAREPGDAVTDYALRNDCDLLVLATHARHGVQAWTRPSVAKPLARNLAEQTAMPALFLPEGAKGFIAQETGDAVLRNILLPIDLSPDSDRAIEAALGLTQLMEADDVTMHFLHVGKGHPVISSGKLAGLKVEYHVDEGDIAAAIGRIAESVDADLIVMATHGHDGFLDVLRGSTTEQVIHHTPRALLAVSAS